LLSALVYHHLDDPVEPPAGWSPSPDPKDVVDDDETGLYFEVWEQVGPDSAHEVVVFRGTQDWKDWWSNLRWLTRFIPTGWDQYDLVRRRIPEVVARGRQRHPNATFATAGHSLGGGLAQQAAYAHPNIKRVVAFDSSPVTGFRSVPTRARVANSKGIRIDRVYERGEILAFLRGFVRRFIPLSMADPAIEEVRFNLSRGDPITEHSMVGLAKRMVKAARDC
jgi:pimeloyl-ACP methyl ester carboxylesterase